MPPAQMKESKKAAVEGRRTFLRFNRSRLVWEGRASVLPIGSLGHKGIFQNEREQPMVACEAMWSQSDLDLPLYILQDIKQ